MLTSPYKCRQCEESERKAGVVATASARASMRRLLMLESSAQGQMRPQPCTLKKGTRFFTSVPDRKPEAASDAIRPLEPKRCRVPLFAEPMPGVYPGKVFSEPTGPSYRFLTVRSGKGLS